MCKQSCFRYLIIGVALFNIEPSIMKHNLALFVILVITGVLGVGCGVINKGTDGLTITQAIPAHSRMLIRIEDESAFKLDIENQSNDTLTLERKGLDNLMITKASIKAIIEPDAGAALSNPTARDVKVKLKVYDHKSKVIHRVEAIKAEAKPAP